MSEAFSNFNRTSGPDLLAEQVAAYAHNRTQFIHARAIGDSPIERLFSAALQAHVEFAGLDLIRALLRVDAANPIERQKAAADQVVGISHAIYIEAQSSVAGWRADFLITYPISVGEEDSSFGQLLIECDGHEFHERTKFQASRDRARDRMAQAGGLPIFRFTGSEIWNDPINCAGEVLAFVSAKMSDEAFAPRDSSSVPEGRR